MLIQLFFYLNKHLCGKSFFNITEGNITINIDLFLCNMKIAKFLYFLFLGRTIYDNLQKAMVYVFSSNVPAILPFFIMGLLEIPFPMGAGFIFLINLIAEIVS